MGPIVEPGPPEEEGPPDAVEVGLAGDEALDSLPPRTDGEEDGEVEGAASSGTIRGGVPDWAATASAAVLV
jgi:hypothetical protein